MKKIFTIALICLSINLFAQWTTVQSGLTYSFKAIHAFDSQTIICGAPFGQIYKSINGGSTWSVFASRPTHDFSFVNINEGFVAAASGNSMGKTSNSGVSWTTITPPNTNSLWCVAAVNNTTAYFGGTAGVLWKTTNGGSSFTTLSTGVTTTISDVVFLNSTTGLFIAQPGGIKRTTNGGTTWTTVSTANSLFEMCFVDNNNGYAVGTSGKVVKTTDGGLTWTVINTGFTGIFQGVSFYDVNNGIVVGSLGKIMRTTDGGVTWTDEVSGTNLPLFDVKMLSPNKAIVVGDSGLILLNNNLPVGIKSNEFTNEMHVFPNPSHDYVNISSDFEMKAVDVFDLAGKLVYSESYYDNRKCTTISGLKQGLYFVEISTCAGILRRKIVIE